MYVYYVRNGVAVSLTEIFNALNYYSCKMFTIEIKYELIYKLIYKLYALSFKCKISAIWLVETACKFLIFLIPTVQISLECET